ncbi:hypothetical protein P170DRAFT_438384 [Aspergillus steynii IBT 23096]|uniref:Cryptic loci regulator 2 N-terminal domain-containing protein n=1 Tax=Aspergillus steynii IBT 23096 TaxID=1392250 RepID=A0A2I2G1B4_9EURO|nr:uncharacterized protein P170DRAFT_438384 [Aspergillus steynii IBT 23096]PLB46673.1 hypothetical protein P170DRAFT_438384 [Aspergillus steynii IBT 23096]
MSSTPQLAQSPGFAEQVIVVPINRSFTDGSDSTWPKDPKYGMPDDSFYREKLAKLWLQKTGAYEPGMQYILDSLPEGYALLDRPRMSKPDIRDKFVWGHPLGQYFFSPIQFFPHFYFLMTGGTTPCPCALCEKMTNLSKEGRKKPGRPIGSHVVNGHLVRPDGTIGPAVKTARTPGKPGRPPGRPGRPSSAIGENPPGRRPGRPSARLSSMTVRPMAVDNEGTPDVFKTAIIELKQQGSLDKAITETESMDWRAERTKLAEFIEGLSMQPAYLPRIGEVVLWTSDFEGELAWNSEMGCLQIYSPAVKQWLGTPEWRAGIIGQVPEEDTVLQDLHSTTRKDSGVNYSGFRVETFPDPHSIDKSYSLHYKYVPLKCIKPFNSYEMFLQGTSRNALHPSIEYAMTTMSSFSLLDKYHFKGTWPDGAIYSRGIFLGAELLVVGDVVRLKPKDPQKPVTDVMVIDEIRLELKQCDDDLKSPHLAERIQVRVRGKVYTNNADRGHYTRRHFFQDNPNPMDPDEVVDAFQYIGMSGYGDWYRVFTTPGHGFDPSQTYDVSQDMILGRCYEPDAMQLLFASLSLGLDLHGVLRGRAYSRQTDDRIHPGRDWFWGDFRTQTLALDSLNGEDVGHYSDARNMKMWHANLCIIDGTAGPKDYQDAKIPGEVGRPATKSRSSFAEVGKLSKLVSTGLGAGDTSNNVSSAEEEPVLPGIEGGDELMDDETSEPEEVFTIPYGELRGGTEESEGGDYRPGR